MAKTPWDELPEVWADEAAFLSKYVRSAVRLAWKRHPVKLEYLKRRKVSAAEVRDQVPAKRIHFGDKCKNAYECESCHDFYAQHQMEVDHIEGGYGFRDFDTFMQWFKRMLYVGFDGLRHICKKCHQDETDCQRWGCTKEQLPLYREQTRFKDLKAAPQKKLLAKLGLPEGKNSTEREAIYWEHLTGDKS